MKLAAIGLVLGGTALGTQIGGADVHEELHTERLVLHSKDRNRIATISSTDSAGLLISLGDARTATTAEVRIEPESEERWCSSFEHEAGTRFEVSLHPESARQVLSVEDGTPRTVIDVGRISNVHGGMAEMQFHSGGDAVAAMSAIGAVDSGPDAPHGFLRLRKQAHLYDDENGNPVQAPTDLLQISGDEGMTVGPWQDEPR